MPGHFPQLACVRMQKASAQLAWYLNREGDSKQIVALASCQTEQRQHAHHQLATALDVACRLPLNARLNPSVTSHGSESRVDLWEQASTMQRQAPLALADARRDRLHRHILAGIDAEHA